MATNMVYCKGCGKEIHNSAVSCPGCGAATTVNKRNRIVAALLAIFLGGFGLHKFYLGRVGQGVVYLLFCWTLIPGLIGFIEGIIYLCMSDQKFAAKYSNVG